MTSMLKKQNKLRFVFVHIFIYMILLNKHTSQSTACNIAERDFLRVNPRTDGPALASR